VVGVEPSSLSVLVELEGACGSCPSSTTTMKMGVERVSLCHLCGLSIAHTLHKGLCAYFMLVNYYSFLVGYELATSTNLCSIGASPASYVLSSCELWRVFFLTYSLLYHFSFKWVRGGGADRCCGRLGQV